MEIDWHLPLELSRGGSYSMLKLVLHAKIGQITADLPHTPCKFWLNKLMMHLSVISSAKSKYNLCKSIVGITFF